jgi:AmiR/NasT family two-component response regulator
MVAEEPSESPSKIHVGSSRSGASAPSPVRAETGYRILVAEDERIVALALSEVLKGLGYEVVGSVGTAGEVIQMASDVKPDMVLMDISLGGPEDGIFAARLIQEHGLAPVVFLTAYSDSRTLRRAAEVEPYGYLMKPLHERELRVAIEIGVARFRAESAREESEDSRESASRDAYKGEGQIPACSWCGKLRTESGS